MINIEKQKERFKNHIASFKDYGNIKIIDFKDSNSNKYRIRFIFEEDYNRLHISGDLGELIAYNYDNMCYEKFSDFINNPGYFEEKIICHSRPLYIYDYEKAKSDLTNQLQKYDIKPFYDFETVEEEIEEITEEVLNDLDEKKGFGSIAYEKLSDIDSECWEWIGDIGKEETGIIELYMLVFKLAQEQINIK